MSRPVNAVACLVLVLWALWYWSDRFQPDEIQGSLTMIAKETRGTIERIAHSLANVTGTHKTATIETQPAARQPRARRTTARDIAVTTAPSTRLPSPTPSAAEAVVSDHDPARVADSTESGAPEPEAQTATSQSSANEVTADREQRPNEQ